MNGAFAMRLAGARVRAALASTVQISLAAIESGSPEDTDVGGVVVSSGITTYQLVLTDDAGGQFKLVNDRIKAGATPTNGEVDPSPSISGLVIFDNQIRVSWTAEVDVLGGFPVTPGVDVYPSTSWNGTAGSGYTVANGYASGPPADPTRTTAKPICRLIGSSRNRFTDDMPLSLRAAAGGLNGATFGIEKLLIHCEGNRFEIPSETLRAVTHPRTGATVLIPGHHALLKHLACVTPANPSGNGDLALYFEVIANDPTMQHRVIGPVYFFRSTTPYDFDLTVDPDQAASGSRYQSFAAALNFLAGRSDAHNNRITAVKTMLGDIGRSGSVVTVWNGSTGRKGKTRIQAAPGKVLTIGRSDLAPTATAATMDPKFQGLEFHQDATTGTLIIDHKNFVSISANGWGATGYGIKLTNSAGPSPLLQKDFIDKTAIDLGGFYFCEIENQRASLQYCQGFYCTMTGCTSDFSTGSTAMIGNRISACSTFPYREDLNAFSVRYPAGGGTIVIERPSGESGPAQNIRLFDPSGDTGKVAISTTPAGSMYYMSQVVAWINARAGWTATLTPQEGKPQSGDGRCAGAMKAINTSATSLTQVLSRFAPHADYRQVEQGTTVSNLISADNICYDNSWQTYLISRGGNPRAEDIAIINEAHYRNNDETSLTSQMSHGFMSHIVFQHVTHLNQNLWFRTSSDAFVPGPYTGFYNCVLHGTAWPDATAITRNPPFFINCHVISSKIAEDTTSTTGGSASALFVDAVNGDFTPAGDLLSNLVTPVAKYDAYGDLWAATDAKGAVRAPA